MNINGIFVTGTDTGVGKTVAAAALLARWREQGGDVVPMKPIQTGCLKENGKLVSPDLRFCLKMADLPIPAGEEDLMAVYKFKPACSPHLAAFQEATEINLQLIVKAAHELMRRHDGLVVEGAGGVMVPLTGFLTMLDLMRALALPVILIARSGLGTINHTLLSLRELRRAGLSVPGVVMVRHAETEWSFIEQDNWKTIERMARTKVLGCLPYMPGIDREEVSVDDFLRTAMECLRWPPAEVV